MGWAKYLRYWGKNRRRCPPGLLKFIWTRRCGQTIKSEDIISMNDFQDRHTVCSIQLISDNVLVPLNSTKSLKQWKPIPVDRTAIAEYILMALAALNRDN